LSSHLRFLEEYKTSRYRGYNTCTPILFDQSRQSDHEPTTLNNLHQLALCRELRLRYDLAVVTNDIYTEEDAQFSRTNEALAPERIIGVETEKMRGQRPFVFTNLKTGQALATLVQFIEEQGCLVG
jgi:hypothetical protein